MTKSDSFPEDTSASPQSGPFSPGATHARYWVAAMLCAAAFIAYVQRNSISVVEVQIRKEFALSKLEMAWVMSGFFFSYALLQVPTGWIAKTWGVRRSLSLFVFVFSALAGGFAMAGGWLTLFISRLGMGVGQAGLFPSSVTAVLQWIPLSRRALVNGLVASCMSLGGAAGVAMMGWIYPVWGWRIAILLFALPGVLWAAAFYIRFRNRPEEDLSVNDAELAIIRGDSQKPSKPKPNIRAEANPEAPKAILAESNASAPQKRRPASNNSRLRVYTAVASLCGQQFFRGAGYIFFASWFATFLRETRGVESGEAGVLNSLPLLAVVVGSPLGGYCSDYVLRKTGSRRLSRQGVAVLAMLACAALIFASYPVANAWLAVLLISAGSFFAAFGGPCAYTAAIDMGGRHTPIVFGLMNMSGNFGAAVFPLIVPLLLNEKEGASGRGNWDLVLITFGAIFIGAAFFWLFADSRVTVDKESDT